MHHHRQPAQCRNGANCFRNREGTCKFSHSDQQPGNMGNDNNQRGPRQNNYPPQSFDRNQGQSFRDRGQNFAGNQGQFQGQNSFDRGNKNWGNQNGDNKPFQSGGHQPNRQNLDRGSNQPNFPKGDQFTNLFCRDYHWNLPCKFEERGKCVRMHGFDKEDKIKRVLYLNEVSTTEPSKLGKFQMDGKNYLILRMGNQINILIYNNQNSKFQPQNTWAFPHPTLNYVHYSQKSNFIYLAAENKNFLYDITVYDILTGNLFTIQQAHIGAVTGVVHFNPQIILTCARDGLIKVWKVQESNTSLDQQSSDRLTKSYFNGKNVELLYIDISVVNGTTLVSAGTNDNRVLFFMGDQLSFYSLSLEEIHAKIFEIRYCIIATVPYAFILTWSKDNLTTSVLAVELNNFGITPLVSLSAKQNIRNSISCLQVFEERVFVALQSGSVTIYKLPTMQKIGLILFKNTVKSIVHAQHVTKTLIKIPEFFVLQNKFQEKPGSLQTFVIKK